MIEEGDRGFACGITGSGKSRLLGYYFANYPGQRLLVDVNDDYKLGPAALEEGACEARDPAAIDWTKRTIRYVPSRLDLDEYEALYAAVWEKARGGRRMMVWLDEAEGPTTANQSPLHLRLALGQGRKKGLTHLAASLRPVEIYKKIRNQSEHAWVFKTADDEDIEVIARRLRLPREQLAGALDALPPYGFLYHRLGQPVASFGPLDKQRLQLIGQHVRMP